MNQDIRLSQKNTVTSSTHTKTPLVRTNNRKILKVAGIIVFLAIIVSIYIIFVQTGDDLDNVVSVKNRIEKHMILPRGEEPALATITDKDRLSTPFLKPAENGDKLLIYQEAKKVILYRPSIDRIIDVGPVSIAQPSDQ